MNLFGKIKPKKNSEVCANCGAALVDGCDFCPKCAAPRQTVKQDTCPVCGMALTEDYDFCPKCAAPRKAGKPNTCPVCGFALRKDQVFCPKCGKRLEAETPSHGAADKLNQNAEKKAKIKKRSVKILAISLIGALLLGIGGYVGLDIWGSKQGQAAVELVKAGDCSGAMQAYEKLNSVSKKFCRKDMIAAFVGLVKANPYVPEESADYLISSVAMEQYAVYQQLAQTLDITSSDKTNVGEYIDTVMQLQPYLKYNEIYACVYKTIDSYTSGNDEVEGNISLAVDVFKVARNVARKYDYQEYLVIDYQKALSDVYNLVNNPTWEYSKGIHKWPEYYDVDPTEYAAVNNAVQKVFDEVENAVKEVDAINQALPVLQ